MKKKCEENSKITNEEFYILENTVNAIINRLHALTISAKLDADNLYRTDNKFKKQVDHKQTVINGASPEVKELYAEMTKLAGSTFIFNMLGWIYIIIPFAVIAIVINSIGAVKNNIVNSMSKISLASDDSFMKFQHAQMI